MPVVTHASIGLLEAMMGIPPSDFYYRETALTEVMRDVWTACGEEDPHHDVVQSCKGFGSQKDAEEDKAVVTCPRCLVLVDVVLGGDNPFVLAPIQDRPVKPRDPTEEIWTP